MAKKSCFDFDLMKGILAEVAANPRPNHVYKPKVEGYTDEEISRYIWLLYEGGYLRAKHQRLDDWYTQDLTLLGGAVLDEMNDNTLAAKIKQRAGKLAGDITPALLAELFKDLF